MTQNDTAKCFGGARRFAVENLPSHRGGRAATAPELRLVPCPRFHLYGEA